MKLRPHAGPKKKGGESQQPLQFRLAGVGDSLVCGRRNEEI